ncbi:MAG: hypothetical protein ACYTHJ_07570 [Planctomycetota bacterium]
MIVWRPEGHPGSPEWLVIGGSFERTGWAGQNVIRANNVALWDGASFSSLGSGTDGSIFSMVIYNGDLIVAGSFQNAGGMSANRIARWDGNSWSAVGGGLNDRVLGLTVFRGELIACGDFTMAGRTDANRIARWDGEAWHALGDGFNNTVRKVTAYGDDLIAGGQFTMAGALPTGYIARWDGAAWSSLDAGLSFWVYELAEFEGDLIVGGAFQLTGTQPVNGIARWDGKQWYDLDGGLVGFPIDPYASALTVYNGKLYVGGEFIMAGDVGSVALARWDGDSWDPFGSYIAGDTGVAHLVPYQRDLYEILISFMGIENVGVYFEPVTTLGDFDGDDDVDLTDMSFIPDCMSGPVGPTNQAAAEKNCLCAFNSDGDSDIDLLDWYRIERAVDPD